METKNRFNTLLRSMSMFIVVVTLLNVDGCYQGANMIDSTNGGPSKEKRVEENQEACPYCQECSRYLYRMNTKNPDNIILTCEECNAAWIDSEKIGFGQTVNNKTLSNMYGGKDRDRFNVNSSVWATKEEASQNGSFLDTISLLHDKKDTGWGLFSLALLIYALTVEPTASFWDCAEYIAAAYKLQVTHPPGAPLLLLIGRMFSFLAGDNVSRVAFWVNMSSVVASAVTVMIFFWIISLLARRIIGKLASDLSPYEAMSIWCAGIIGALSLTFSSTFWSNATETETYASSTLLMSLVLWAMLNWEITMPNPRSYQWLVLVAYLIGLSLGLRMFSVLTLPALCFIFYFKRREKVNRLGVLGILGIGSLLIFVVYGGITLSLPIVATKVEIGCVNGLGLPRRSGIILLMGSLGGGLLAATGYTLKKRHITMHTFLLMVCFVLMGYATYGLVLVRAQANPPINEGHPSDVIGFTSYLRREQYGHRALLYGPHFAAQVRSAKKGKPIYRYIGKKYEVISHQQVPIFSATSCSLFPRTWSQQPIHIAAYRNMLNLAPGQVPHLADQLYFFIKHQLGHFYLRYFLWNFSGREHDLVGAAWTTPLDAFKKQVSGDVHAGSGSNYFLLPFILGLIGLFYQYRKDRRYVWVVGTLFLMLGAALVVFLNLPPIEPRERDYIYVGSYMIFTLWIGLGTLATILSLKQRGLSDPLSIGTGFVMCLTVPLLMAVQGWSTHDRSKRYFAVESAKNMLNSCAPNAILFTAGDNDTFPLWYVQEVEGFRTDVRVVILSYTNAAWYIAQLMRTVNHSQPLPLSIGLTSYQSYGLNDVLPYVPRPHIEALDLRQYLQLIRDEHPALQVKNTVIGNYINTLPCKKFYLPITEHAIAKKLVPKSHHHLIPTKLEWQIRGAKGMDKKDLVVLDLIATNHWERPIYFNHSSLASLNIDLSAHVMHEGITLRLLPIQNTTGEELIHTEVMYENLMNRFHWQGMHTPGVYYDENYRLAFIRNHRMAFCILAKGCLEEGKVRQAQEALLRSLTVMPDEVVPYDLATVYMLPLLFEVGERERALQIAHTLGKRAEEVLTSSMYVFDGRKSHEQWIILDGIVKSLMAAGYQEQAKAYEACTRGNLSTVILMMAIYGGGKGNIPKYDLANFRMNAYYRTYVPFLLDQLRKQKVMLFLMGARQVGKTTIAQLLADPYTEKAYFNWDVDEHRAQILTGQKFIEKVFPPKRIGVRPVVIFDELHKYKLWKNFIKGFYDLYKDEYHILVTGSARLNIFQKGGDSLMGRYLPFTIHPFSVGELNPHPLNLLVRAPFKVPEEEIQSLYEFGGFPVPFLHRDPTIYQQWRRTRKTQLFREDIRDLTQVHEISQLELCAEMIGYQTGNILNRSTIANKLQVGIQTIGRWVETLKEFFYAFTVPPWSNNIPHSLIKEPKIYVTDWSLVADPGARFENFVACHLKKSIDLWNEQGKGAFEMYFLRDKGQREVDFLVTRENQPWLLIEAKTSEQPITSAMHYYQEKTKAPFAFQVTKDMPYVSHDCFKQEGMFIVPASTFLSQLV
eukprot:gene218-287_t